MSESQELNGIPHNGYNIPYYNGLMTIPILYDIIWVFQFLTMTHTKLMCNSFIIINYKQCSKPSVAAFRSLVDRISLNPQYIG